MSPVSARFLTGWLGVISFVRLEGDASSGTVLLFGWPRGAFPSGAILFGSMDFSLLLMFIVAQC